MHDHKRDLSIVFSCLLASRLSKPHTIAVPITEYDMY